ncbi:hypothetical protein IMG5_151870 [Ichthyophthirius multifiliis]|uniref:Uncharacterized protein n=1 Tax=Ichthyophthirius multifiliis TaxID=5932 RepID=G0QYS7_ICHMU|nr:hypothetical protein IMG5_151870 [Ichthyophthirius multifiliis]EGR29638.1 hypothetical protein IMG5_151870 [Ichthyophthirius multifiliis]|eukprot:XP_004030874.1 hypothetical protein IMG5_151870 [Ichthyophthirius multifiliis]
MYKHLIQLYDLENDIDENDFNRMIQDPELYGMVWEDFLIMTENIEELLIETEYDQKDIDRSVNELKETWDQWLQDQAQLNKSVFEDSEQQIKTEL